MGKEQIKEIALYHQASARTQRRMIEEGQIIRASKNDYIFQIRDHVEQIYIVLSGYVVLQREDEDHGKRCLFLLQGGSILNEVILDYIPASVSAVAVSDVTIAVYSRPVFLNMMEQDFRFNKYVVDSMALKIRKLYHMMETSTKTTKLDHQVASRIWKFARDFGVEKEAYVELPFELSITMLANFVGSNRETVSRIVSKITKEGILSIERGCCRIYDLEKLLSFGKVK